MQKRRGGFWFVKILRVVHTDSNRYSLIDLSERWDYLNEFEWSVRRVMVENIAVIVKYLSFKENYY